MSVFPTIDSIKLCDRRGKYSDTSELFLFVRPDGCVIWASGPRPGNLKEEPEFSSPRSGSNGQCPVCTSLHQSADLSRHCSTAAGEKFCSYEACAGGAHPSHPGTGLLTGHLQPGAGAGEYIDIF